MGIIHRTPEVTWLLKKTSFLFYKLLLKPTCMCCLCSRSWSQRWFISCVLVMSTHQQQAVNEFKKNLMWEDDDDEDDNLDKLSGCRETAYEGETNDVGAKKQKEQKKQRGTTEKTRGTKMQKKSKRNKEKSKEMLLQSQKQQKEEENHVHWTRFSGPKPHGRFIKLR